MEVPVLELERTLKSFPTAFCPTLVLWSISCPQRSCRTGSGPNLGETPNAKDRVTSKRRTDSPQRRARGAGPDENGGVTSGESRPAVGPCRSNEGGSGVARQRKPAASDV